MTKPVQEVIVVEGKNDSAAVRRAVQADTIETGGSAVNSAVLDRIRLAHKKRGVIVLTDPDHAGERIRRIVRQAIPGCKHAFIPRHQVIKNGKLGIEHASPAMIRTALARVRTEIHEADEDDAHVSWQDIVTHGFTAHPKARKRRQRIGEILGIGYANARTFYERLRMYRIDGDEFWQAVEQFEQEEADGS